MEGPLAQEGPPIFIVGAGRSGTTLLRLMLSAHPRIYICHETSFYFWERFLPGSVSGDDFLRRFFWTFNFRWLAIDPRAVLARLPSHFPREQAGLAFEAIMRLKAASYSRVRYGDKTPAHSFAL